MWSLIIARTLNEDQPLTLLLNLLFYHFNRSEHTYKSQRNLATLRMFLKPDKLPSLTTSYRPISLISSIMKLFERVIEQRLRSHLENIGFLNKHQSGFRRAKCTDDHQFRLSQSIMESFNR